MKEVKIIDMRHRVFVINNYTASTYKLKRCLWVGPVANAIGFNPRIRFTLWAKPSPIFICC